MKKIKRYVKISKYERIKKDEMKTLYISNSAITLISLVITIILLIILAGIAINLSLGENGLFSKAKYAKEKYLNAQSKEEEELNELYEQLGIVGDLPENTKEIEAGTIVKLPNEWEKYTPTYVSKENGKEVIASKKVASVYAVSSGNGETIPVPYGFYYVGGNLGSGVVISDNKADKNEYVGQADVPNGVEIKDGKFVDILKGNQFVFIPCNENEYKKTNWGQGDKEGVSNCYWATDTNGFELAQIEKYGGFYVGRYEAGLPTSQDGFNSETGFISALGTIANSLAGDSSQYNSIKTPISKAGREPWNFIEYNNAWLSARKMYNTNSVQSNLITGTQWDVIINKISSTDPSKSLTNSKAWGNHYSGEAFNYKGRTAEYKKNENKLYGYGDIEESGTKENNTYRILTTGASEHNKAYNLYDVAGNLWEHTDESSAAYNSIGTLPTCRVIRGGSCYYNSSAFPVLYRHGIALNVTNYSMGFRVVLHIV